MITPNDLDKLKIEKGIPIPPIAPITRVRDVLSKMEVGDSFVIHRKHKQAFYSAAKHLGMELTTRTLTRGGFNLRIWRTR